MKHLVYRITHLATGRYYIGIHSTANEGDGYMGSGVWIKHAVKKYGTAAFKKKILFSVDTRKEAARMESLLVHVERSLCMNMMPGGQQDIEFTDVHRAKIAEGKRGVLWTEEQRKNCMAGQRGCTKPERSEEHRARLAEAQRGRKASDTARENMRQSQLGTKQSEATKAKRKTTWAVKRALK